MADSLWVPIFLALHHPCVQVGPLLYTTCNTMKGHGAHLLSVLAGGQLVTEVDDEDYLFLDRDPTWFSGVLAYLRGCRHIAPDPLNADFTPDVGCASKLTAFMRGGRYYQIQGLHHLLRERRLVASCELRPCIAIINRRLLPQGIIVYLYDITAQKWYSTTYQRELYQGAWEYDTSFRQEVSGFATCRQGRFIYVIGAFVHPVTKKLTIDRLDIRTGVLELVAPLDETSLEKGCICAAYIKESSIWVVSHDVSDYYNPTPPMLHIIDPASGTTQKLPCVGHAPGLLCYRYATCLLQGRLISVGGQDDESGAWKYDVPQQSWRILSNMKQPRERATGVQWDDKAAVVGGHDKEHSVDTVEVFNVQSGC